MTAVTPATTATGLPFARPLTRADLEDLPDDGHRYELVDGTLVVSPAPRVRHQEVVGGLHVLLRAACPAHLRVLFAPVAVALADDTELQPDLLVAPRAQFTERELLGPPLLAVEVLSASTRRVDRLLKRDRLQEAGCPAYWLVDPDEPALLVLELDGGQYREVARAVGHERVAVTSPFPLELAPSDLVE